MAIRSLPSVIGVVIRVRTSLASLTQQQEEVPSAGVSLGWWVSRLLGRALRGRTAATLGAVGSAAMLFGLVRLAGGCRSCWRRRRSSLDGEVIERLPAVD